MLSRSPAVILLVAALAMPLDGVAQDPPPQPQPAPEPIDGNLVDVLEDKGDYDRLLEALDAAGVLETFQADPGPVTLFAPTDDAFEELPEDEWAQLLQSPQDLQAMLAYHVVPAAAMESGELAQAGQAETLLGVPLEVDARQDEMVVGEATVEEADVDAANGVVHGIDEVLTPPQGPTQPPQSPES